MAYNSKPTYFSDDTDFDRETSFDKEDSFYPKLSETRNASRKDANFYQKEKEDAQNRQIDNNSKIVNEELVDESVEKINQKDNKNDELKENIKAVLKFIISNLSLLIILSGYVSLGAWMFQALEQANELQWCWDGKHTEAQNVIALKQTLLNYVKYNVSLSSGDISKDNQTTAIANIESLLIDFRNNVLSVKSNYAYTGQDCSYDSSVWNFMNVVLFTITIVSTVGYGQISPKTPQGQIICIVYATVGIPIFLMCCSNISGIFAKMFRFTYSRICCGICYISDKKKAEKAKLQKQAEREQKLEEKKNNPAVVVDDLEDEADEEEKVSVPLTITIAAIFLYLVIGAVMFKNFEEWEFIASMYFCYITLSTIGFGDMVPGQDFSDPNRYRNMAIGIIYIFFGLAILAMCFDLMQEEIIAKFTWVGTKLGIMDQEEDEEEEELDKKEPDESENKKNLLESNKQPDDILNNEKKIASNQSERFSDDDDEPKKLPLAVLPLPKIETQSTSMAEAIRLRQQRHLTMSKKD